MKTNQEILAEFDEQFTPTNIIGLYGQHIIEQYVKEIKQFLLSALEEKDKYPLYVIDRMKNSDKSAKAIHTCDDDCIFPIEINTAVETEQVEPETPSDWREEFDKYHNELRNAILEENDEPIKESECVYFGYQVARGNEVFSVVDFGNIKQFIAKHIQSAEERGYEKRNEELKEKSISGITKEQLHIAAIRANFDQATTMYEAGKRAGLEEAIEVVETFIKPAKSKSVLSGRDFFSRDLLIIGNAMDAAINQLKERLTNSNK